VSDIFSRMEPGQLIGLVAVSGGLLCAILAVLSNRWVEIRKSAGINELKQNMLDRGMSAEEIQTVLNAGTFAGKFACGKRSCRV
jgi:hypothetical protein